MSDINGQELHKPEVNLTISVALIGARLHYAVPIILHKRGYLKSFYTDIYFKDFALRYTKLISRWLHAKLRLRNAVLLPDDRVLPLYRFGVSYRLRKYFGGKFERSLGKLWVWAGVKFDETIVDHLRHSGSCPDIIYGLNSASKELFEYCRSRGVTAVLEQCSAPMEYENRIMSEEYKLFPSWEIDLYIKNVNCEEFVAREKDEWALADLIIVPSNHVKKSLEDLGVCSKKISVVPYGYNSTPTKPSENCERDVSKFNILFVGGMRLQKGIQYFFELSQSLSDEDFNFRVVGPNCLRSETLDKIKESLNVIGKVSRDDMNMQYEWADVLVVPSLSEGSATVVYEALSHGVPVICTENSGAVITHGKEGYIVAIRDVQAIKKHILAMREDHHLLESLRMEARETSERFTVEKYGDTLISTILECHSANAQ